ncbi:MAG TPA: stage II sporulation protein M, partial [Albitalea sp.]|nr:stage II sporulation protein M [Albitalea sp.]
MTPLQFEADYRALWDELDEAVAQIEGAAKRRKKDRSAKPKPLDAARIAALYRTTCEHLALARARAYPIHLTERLEDLTQRAHQIVYRRPANSATRLARLFLVDVPEAVRAHRLTMWIAVAAFVLPLVVLGVLSYFDPGFVLSTHDAASVRRYDQMYGGDGASPVGRERAADTDWAMFGFYIMNNIGVAFRCFAGGVFFGLGSLFFIAYNAA